VGSRTESDIKETNIMSDYIINAHTANRLVYSRFGEKYISDMEKRKNSNISSLAAPNLSCSYLINIKKLIDENNIDGEKKDFKNLKTSNMTGKVS